MTSNSIYNITLIAWLVLSPFIGVVLLFIVAPYGRHVRSGWGLALDSKIGWVVMESVSPIIFALSFIWDRPPYR